MFYDLVLKNSQVPYPQDEETHTGPLLHNYDRGLLDIDYARSGGTFEASSCMTEIHHRHILRWNLVTLDHQLPTDMHSVENYHVSQSCCNMTLID